MILYVTLNRLEIFQSGLSSVGRYHSTDVLRGMLRQDEATRCGGSRLPTAEVQHFPGFHSQRSPHGGVKTGELNDTAFTVTIDR